MVSVYGSLDDVRMAVDHLVGFGHRRFAYIGFAGSRGSDMRRQALIDELANRNLRLHKVVEVAEGAAEGLRDGKYVRTWRGSKKPARSWSVCSARRESRWR